MKNIAKKGKLMFQNYNIVKLDTFAFNSSFTIFQMYGQGVFVA